LSDELLLSLQILVGFLQGEDLSFYPTVIGTLEVFSSNGENAITGHGNYLTSGKDV
jgi:hypothetical protein